MQLWVGLGNPGPQYAMNRHNVGFMALDTIADVHDFGPVQKKFLGWLQEGRIGGEKILLLKPATFMNESGRAVGEALRFYKLGLEALTVFHDELDIAPFKVKVKHGGGTAGHNGLRSIDQHLGADFRRVGADAVEEDEARRVLRRRDGRLDLGLAGHARGHDDRLARGGHPFDQGQVHDLERGDLIDRRVQALE